MSILYDPLQSKRKNRVHNGKQMLSPGWIWPPDMLLKGCWSMKVALLAASLLLSNRSVGGWRLRGRRSVPVWTPSPQDHWPSRRPSSYYWCWPEFFFTHQQHQKIILHPLRNVIKMYCSLPQSDSESLCVPLSPADYITRLLSHPFYWFSQKIYSPASVYSKCSRQHLRWLPVHYRTDAKILLLVQEVIGLAPQCVSDQRKLLCAGGMLKRLV